MYSQTKGLVNFKGATDYSLPINFIRYDTYTATPDQKTDIDSGMDSIGFLHRNVLPHKRTKIEFQLKKMTNAQWKSIYSKIQSRFLSEHEDLNVEFYNTKTDEYRTGHFYLVEPEMYIERIEGSIVHLEETRIALIEY